MDKLMHSGIIYNRKAKSVALQQIIEVSQDMWRNNNNYTDSVKLVAKKRKLRSNSTIYDACSRRIGLSSEEFKDLTKDRKSFIKHLIKQFPDDKYAIISELGSKY